MSYGLPLVITAPSGAGKSTLIKKLCAEFPQFQFSISYTTRKARDNEVHAKDYYFISEEEFEAKIQTNFFAEWAKVHGNYYGTPLDEVEKNLKNGKDVLFDIDIQGASQLFLSLTKAYFIFIFPPNMEELEKRLRGRKTDTEEAIQKRLVNAYDEIKQAHWFNAWIVNDDLEKAYKELKACFIAAKLQPQKHTLFLNSFIDSK